MRSFLFHLLMRRIKCTDEKSHREKNGDHINFIPMRVTDTPVNKRDSTTVV